MLPKSDDLCISSTLENSQPMSLEISVFPSPPFLTLSFILLMSLSPNLFFSIFYFLISACFLLIFLIKNSLFGSVSIRLPNLSIQSSNTHGSFNDFSFYY